MGLLEKLWDDTVAGPQPDSGLGKLRKYNTFNLRSPSGKEMMDVRSYGDEGGEEVRRVTRSIMIMKPSSAYQNGSPPVSPAGGTPPVSPFSGSRGSFRFRRGSTDADEKAGEAGIRRPSTP